MSGHAVCYAATEGYLFHTVVSALQARAHTDDAVGVYVVCLSRGGSREEETFRRVCAEHGVELISAPIHRLNGLHPTYSRLLLDEFLPEQVEEVLYLDGDTQVVQDINPLVRASTPVGGVLAAVDPMVFIRRSHKALKNRIDGWWDSSDLSAETRQRYVNAGVLRVSRRDLAGLREQIFRDYGDRLRDFHFLDQDAINLACGDRIDTISMSWNFPGFLLDTQMVEITPPRIVHFMSNPRPWHAPLSPWGHDYYRPYSDLVREHPDLEEYWVRLAGRRKIRYALQQRYKQWTERPNWQSPEAAESVSELERRTRPLT
jgi:lipopolysaccharide biosynthesis glycosyltransferase